MEADVYPKNHPERSDLIDGSIGELSPFHSGLPRLETHLSNAFLATVPDANHNDLFIENDVANNVRTSPERNEQFATSSLVVERTTHARILEKTHGPELNRPNGTFRSCRVSLQQEIEQPLDVVARFRQPNEFHSARDWRAAFSANSSIQLIISSFEIWRPVSR